jgi:hypothetical protein
MAWLEALGAAGEADGAEGGAGGLGGITRDFNDNPVGHLQGSSGGNPVTSIANALGSSFGTGGVVQDQAPIGPMRDVT